MTPELSADFSKMNESAFESLRNFSELGVRMFERLGEAQIGFVSHLMDVGTRHLSALTDARGYQELVTVESGLLSQYNQILIDSAKQIAGIVTESKEELTDLMEKGLDAAPATPAARKTTRRKTA